MTEQLKMIFPEKGRDILDILASILFGIIAAVFYISLFLNIPWMSEIVAIIHILCAAFSLALSVWLFYRFRLSSLYESRTHGADVTYEIWKQLFGRQRLFLGLLTLLLLIAVYPVTRIAYSAGPYNYYEMAVLICAMVFTCLEIFIVCEITLHRFMQRQLDILMANAQEANQKIIDAAVTAERESISAAIRSEQLKVDLISNVSHDLKTPLTSMVGYIDLMKKEELSETMADYVNVLSAKAEKLKEMIESLFSLAKTSSGNIELHPEPLCLNRLIEQIYADMEDKINASGLEFVTELTAADTELVTDSSYLYRICQNLIENTLKYSALNTRVFLKTSSTPTETGRLIRFEITNTSGYRMDFTKEQIVERFSRGDKARSSEGNGLGLAIVSTYTSALGGRFDVLLDCDQFKAIVEFEKATGTTE